MKLSTRCKYAVMGLFDMAYNSPSTGTQVRQIAERQEIPMRFLEQIFQDLRRADIVTGKRGRNGGYVLAKQPAEITIYDIVIATDGPLEFSRTIADDGAATIDIPNLTWQEVEKSFAIALEQHTLKSRVDHAIDLGVPRGDPGYMYFI